MEHRIIQLLSRYLGSFNLLLLGTRLLRHPRRAREALTPRSIAERTPNDTRFLPHCLLCLWRQRSLIEANLSRDEFNTLYPRTLKCFTTDYWSWLYISRRPLLPKWSELDFRRIIIRIINIAYIPIYICIVIELQREILTNVLWISVEKLFYRVHFDLIELHCFIVRICNYKIYLRHNKIKVSAWRRKFRVLTHPLGREATRLRNLRDIGLAPPSRCGPRSGSPNTRIFIDVSLLSTANFVVVRQSRYRFASVGKIWKTRRKRRAHTLVVNIFLPDSFKEMHKIHDEISDTVQVWTAARLRSRQYTW